ERWPSRFRCELGEVRRCGQWRKRIRNVSQGDLLKRLVDCDGVGRPSRMHDEHNGSGAAATRIAAIAFADGAYRFVIGVEGRERMIFQIAHRVPSEVRCFPWEKNHSHAPHRDLEEPIENVML